MNKEHRNILDQDWFQINQITEHQKDKQQKLTCSVMQHTLRILSQGGLHYSFLIQYTNLWYSKCQNTVESITSGSEFVTLIISAEMNETPRYNSFERLEYHIGQRECSYKCDNININLSKETHLPCITQSQGVYNTKLDGNPFCTQHQEHSWLSNKISTTCTAWHMLQCHCLVSEA